MKRDLKNDQFNTNLNNQYSNSNSNPVSQFSSQEFENPANYINNYDPNTDCLSPQNISNTIKEIEKNHPVNEEIVNYLKNISNGINSIVSFLNQNPTQNIENTQKQLTEAISKQIELEKELQSEFKYKENTLVISYIDKHVILPFSYEEIQNIYTQHPSEYSSLEDVVEKKYIKSDNIYRNGCVSRFKEAFKLIKEREGGSNRKALDLALEVFMNFSIHPAIISSCKSLNELDIYLACLEYNELSDFHIFNIEFIAPPIKVEKTFKFLNFFRKIFKAKSFE